MRINYIEVILILLVIGSSMSYFLYIKPDIGRGGLYFPENLSQKEEEQLKKSMVTFVVMVSLLIGGVFLLVRKFDFFRSNSATEVDIKKEGI